jgi:hypothetical protein
VSNIEILPFGKQGGRKTILEVQRREFPNARKINALLQFSVKK